MLTPDLYAFISVLVRAVILVSETIALGGVIIRLVTAKLDIPPAAVAATNRLLVWSASVLAIAEITYVALDSAELMQAESLALEDVAGAGFFVSGVFVAAAAAALAAFAGTRVSRFACPPLAFMIVCGIVMTSHSMARIDGRTTLVALTMGHQLAAAAWIGGMPHLMLIFGQSSEDTSLRILRRFSCCAMVSVAILISAGFLMTRSYVGSWPALGETSYGLMLAGKVILTSLMLILGALNFRIVRSGRYAVALRRFMEAEAGIGITVIIAAASLASSPLAIDLPADRVPAAVIANRVQPAWPRLRTPEFSQLAPATAITAATVPSGLLYDGASNPNAAPDIAWSEYNHHWAGIVLLAIGTLSLFARRWRWARCWPLAFLGLALFLLIRADSENWPLGPRGFWESFQVAEVAQHRLFVALIVAFAIFEWRVQNSQSSGRAALVFPLVCAAGGALLLLHSHSLRNIREQFLTELSHLPLGLLAVTAGWSRWLELRMLPTRLRVVNWIWPVCFVLIGMILLNYREA